jgi:hypothetical protein
LAASEVDDTAGVSWVSTEQVADADWSASGRRKMGTRGSYDRLVATTSVWSMVVSAVETVTVEFCALIEVKLTLVASVF